VRHRDNKAVAAAADSVAAAAEAGSFEDAAAADLAAAVSRVVLTEGDFLKHDLSDATIIFINNTVFEESLSAPLWEKLVA
jgi:hypothetical protein